MTTVNKFNSKKTTNRSPSDSFSDLISRLNDRNAIENTQYLQHLVCDFSTSNTSKLQFLKAEIEAGRYQIQSIKIAEKINEYKPFLTELEPA